MSIYTQPASTAYQQAKLIEGLGKLRNAALLNIIATLISGGAVLILLSSGYLGAFMGRAATAGLALGSLMGVLAAAIIGILLSLISIFAFLVPAFSRLREYNPSRFGTPAKLIKIGYIVGFILVLIAVLLLLAAVVGATGARSPHLALGGIYGALALAVIGGILVFIGQVGVIVGMFRLKDELDSSTFLAAGILFIIGIFISILNFIGWILVFVGAGSSLSKIRSGYVTPGAQPPGPPSSQPPPPPPPT